ncbi:hypothetical protein KPH14_013015, partial [Odynerus spinipes]
WCGRREGSGVSSARYGAGRAATSPRQPPTSSSSVTALMVAALSATMRCVTPWPLGCGLLDGQCTKNLPLRPPWVEESRTLYVREMTRCTWWTRKLSAEQHRWTTHTTGSSATIVTTTP